MTDSTVKEIFMNHEHVENYEKKTRKSNWLGPEIMFGMAYRHVNPGDKLLDMGIGTGLCSELFFKAGLTIYGMDFSPKMLDICRGKNITAELKEHDLQGIPYPYENNSMDHVICGGVLHCLPELASVISEVSRIIRTNGVFTFCNMEHEHDEPNSTPKHPPFPHDKSTIMSLLEKNHFKFINCLGFEVLSNDIPKPFAVYTAKSIKRTI